MVVVRKVIVGDSLDGPVAGLDTPNLYRVASEPHLLDSFAQRVNTPHLSDAGRETLPSCRVLVVLPAPSVSPFAYLLLHITS